MPEKYNTSNETLLNGEFLDLSLKKYPFGNFALLSPDMIDKLNKIDSQRLLKEKRFPILLDGTSGIGVELLLTKSTGDKSYLTLSSFGEVNVNLIGCPKISAVGGHVPENVLHDGSAVNTHLSSGYQFKVDALSGDGIIVEGKVTNIVRVSFKRATH